MCIRLSKATKLCQIPMLMILIPKAKMRTEALTIPLQYFIVITVYSEPATVLAICQFKKRQWLLPQYCGTKGPIGYFHQTNQNSGFQTVAATLEMLLPPNQSASV